MMRNAFFAYPGQPPDLISTINAAAKILRQHSNNINLKTWQGMDVFGQSIPEEVRANIDEAATLVCDVTRPNMNVYYEAGYAIGKGKTIAPVLNGAFANAADQIRQDGMFDNIGYKTHQNSAELAQIILGITRSNLSDLFAKPINHQQPLFLLDSHVKTDFRNAIVSAIKASKTFYRSFDPVEVPRFSSIAMIAEASASSGVIIPILAEHIVDASRHNLRAAFLAGLCHGLGRQTLLLSMGSIQNPNPSDYRDMVVSVRNEEHIGELVQDFAKNSLVASQSIGATNGKKNRNLLQKLTLGASAAENEFRTLEEYFVETFEYLRTLRGEVSVVAGRKGSGKTAIFFRVRDTHRLNKNAIVTDLKPESHQLSQFREELLKIVDAGVFDHTLASFWYFVILSEMLITIKRRAEHKAKYDMQAYGTVREIDEVLAGSGSGSEESGDFTSRINRMGKSIILEIERANAANEKLSSERLTNIVFRDGIAKIRGLILKYTTSRSKLILLFDNIDKGWPANGVHAFDIRMVRLLTEVLDKIRNDFNTVGREFNSVVFLRNDIYELLVENTPDRGKAGQIRIDWTDRAKLKLVIFQRMQASSKNFDASFEQMWTRIFSSNVCNQDSFDYFLDHCLMRPRFLINLLENAIANGINRGHLLVDEADCVDAVRQHSLNLIEDFGYEIRDASGLSEDILYSLVGVTNILTREEITQHFEQVGILESDKDKAFTLMLWYGVIGIVNKDSRPMFIYDYHNIRRLEAEMRAMNGDNLFQVNPALHVGLSN